MQKADVLARGAVFSPRSESGAHAGSVVRGSWGKDWTWLELGRARVRAVASSALPGLPCRSGHTTAVRAAGMFRKARRVNVRKRNDSEEEERERDEEQEPPPLLPPPGTGEEPGPGDRAPGGESLLGPGLPPPPSALAPGPGTEAGGCFPGGAEPGNGLKPRKRPRENKEVPRASLLSFQDEDEGNCRASAPPDPDIRFPGPDRGSPHSPDAQPQPPGKEPFPAGSAVRFPRLRPSALAGDAFLRRHQPCLNYRLLFVVSNIFYSEGPDLRLVI